MHRMLIFLSALLLSFNGFAQEHDHVSDADFMKVLASMSKHGPVVEPDFSGKPNSTVTIDMIARSFSFSPSTFTVNQGDNVVINFNVPANDPATSHGLLMDTYVDPGKNCNRGQTITITFTATTPGQFVFGCNVPTCGSGHSNMFGTMTVNAASNPPPAITTINPTSGPTTGGTSVTITGVNFANGATVKFGSLAAKSTSVNSSTSIVAVTPAAATAGNVTVSVTNPDNQIATFNSFNFTVPGPTITSISPTSGPTSGGTPITISGTGFQAGATVTIGGLPAHNVTVVSASTITATTGLGLATQQATLPQDVVVHNPDGSAPTLAGGFTWTVPALSITRIAPDGALPAGGSQILIFGTGFTTAVNSSVTFGGVAATNVSVIDPVTMSVTVPAHGAGAVDVVVKVGANSATATNGFVYDVPGTKHRAARH